MTCKLQDVLGVSDVFVASGQNQLQHLIVHKKFRVSDESEVQSEVLRCC